MKYFLFISFRSGLVHNVLYESLLAVRESLRQLVDEENLVVDSEELPEAEDLKNHFASNDYFCGALSNGTWFHIQETPDENIERFFRKELTNSC